MSATRPRHIPSGLYPGSGRRLPVVEGNKTVSAPHWDGSDPGRRQGSTGRSGRAMPVFPLVKGQTHQPHLTTGEQVVFLFAQANNPVPLVQGIVSAKAVCCINRGGSGHGHTVHKHGTVTQGVFNLLA